MELIDQVVIEHRAGEPLSVERLWLEFGVKVRDW
jgi:hypothetical protein